MRTIFLILLSLNLTACSQPPGGIDEPTRSSQIEIRLSDYAGQYEYVNHSTLIMVPGPDKALLYASINEARYPLRPIRKDVFLNGGDVEVIFVRGDNNEITGYRENKSETLEDNPFFRLLDKSKRLPASIWHARQENVPEDYAYRAPENLDDGIFVRPLQANDPLLQNLTAMTTAIYAEEYPGVQSVLVYQDGALVFEEYFYEFDRDKLHQQRSATKTLMALLVGAALGSGDISSIDDKVLPYFSEYKAIEHLDGNKRSLSVGDLLSMQSGFDCNDWDSSSQGNESKMIETEDWARFILDLPMLAAPGVMGSYCSGNVILIGRMIEKAAGKPLQEYAHDVLFEPLGITAYEWDFRPDVSNVNNYVQAWLRPRDMMKIGILMADGGIWQGQQVIPRAWISQLMAKQSEIQNTPYGYFFWRRYLIKDGRRFEIPQASGNGGQKIILLEELDTIIVLTGGGYNQPSHTKELLAKYIFTRAH